MNWFTGLVLYVLIWWVTLFAVLPFGTRPSAQPDAQSGWRGAPEQPRVLRKVLVTSVVAAIVWVAVYYLVIANPWLSFYHGILAPARE